MAYTLNPSEALPYGQGSQFAPNTSGGIVNYSTGSIVMDATSPVAAVVPVGFTPRKIRVIDITNINAANGGEFEYVDMFPANTTLKTVYTAGAGVKTVDTTGAITIGTELAGTGRSFIVAAAALTASHTYVFEAWA